MVFYDDFIFVVINELPSAESLDIHYWQKPKPGTGITDSRHTTSN